MPKVRKRLEERDNTWHGIDQLTGYHTGAWTIHFVLLLALKILFDIIPGVTQEVSWTLTNISYMFGSYLMFHYVRGVPFEFNAGAYDNLNMWEQMDNGDQYTPAKKFLLSVPIVLFLLSTHYTHYDLTYFLINFLALMAVVVPKLPWVSSSSAHQKKAADICAESSHASRPLLRTAGRPMKFR
jgi:ORMDL family